MIFKYLAYRETTRGRVVHLTEGGKGEFMKRYQEFNGDEIASALSRAGLGGIVQVEGRSHKNAEIRTGGCIA